MFIVIFVGIVIIILLCVLLAIKKKKRGRMTSKEDEKTMTKLDKAENPIRKGII